MASLALAGLLYTSVSLCTPAAVPAPSAPRPAEPAIAAGLAQDPDLEALWAEARPFTAFLAAADRRKAMWDTHYGEGRVDADHVARVAAVPGSWRILAVAEDACSDSVNTIPYLALLAERADNVEIRVIDSRAGRALMEAHRTPDGRAATPTVLLLDDDGSLAGCWVERPARLQEWALESRPGLSDREFVSQKQDWYDADGGTSTVSEVVAVLEAAGRGERVCPGR